MQFLGKRKKMKKEISKAAGSCYPTMIMYKRRLMRSQDGTWPWIGEIVQGIELKL